MGRWNVEHLVRADSLAGAVGHAAGGAAGGVSGTAHRTDAIAAAEERALQTLQSVAGTQQRLIQNTRQFLQQLAAMPQVHDPAAPPVRALPGRSAVAQHHLRQHRCATGGR